MKKTLLFVIALIAFSSYSFAEVVSESRAREVAAEFFFGNYATKSQSNTLSLVDYASSGAPDSKSYSGSNIENLYPAFYAYNRLGGGFIFISGDDCVDPVIGYSMEGEYNTADVPPALQWWLEGVRRTIESKRSSGAVQDYSTRLAWKNTSTRATGEGTYDYDGGGKQLDTPQWNQGSPFNDLCPAKTSGSGNCPCGCVATAMAELMGFYAYPAKPVTNVKVPAYTYTNSAGKSISVAEAKLTDWNYKVGDFPKSKDNAWNDDQKTAVAILLKDIGHTVQMDYGNTGSGAHTERIVNAMGTYFGFNKGAVLKYRDQYSLKDWIDMMVQSIDEGHPMLTSGTSSEGGGHQFIVDGYDGNHLMRFNFGWGKSSNGYWALGANEYAIDFSAIFNLYPDKEGSSEFAQSGLHFNYWSNNDPDDFDEYAGLQYGGTVKVGQSFEILCAGLSTTGPSDFSGYLRLALKDKKGNVTDDNYDSNPSYSINVGLIGAKYLYAKVSKTFAVGDRIVPQYSHSTSGPWTTIPATTNGSMIGEYPLVPYAFIDVPASCAVNTECELTLKNAPYRWYDSATWYVLEPGSSVEEQASFGSPAFESVDSNSYKFESTGTYRIRVVVRDPFTGSVIDNISTKVTVY